MITAENTNNTPESNQEWYLPGGLFIWIISLHEFLLFSIGIGIYKYQAHANLTEFTLEKNHLNLFLGIAYTLLLLASGWMIAEALASYKDNQIAKARKYLFAGMSCGTLFLIIKIFDFNEKLLQGKNFGSNTFWTLYWFLNSFHFVHILIGSSLLLSFYLKTKKNPAPADIDSFTSLAVFWHICDIIWILIFSTFYLNL